jgi:hypothetical protein
MPTLAHKIGQSFHPSSDQFGHIDQDRTGTLLFCPDCGTLLNLPKDDEPSVICEQCEHEEPASCV